MQEDRDKYVTTTSCPYLLGFAIINFATFYPLLFVFQANYSFTLPFD